MPCQISVSLPLALSGISFCLAGTAERSEINVLPASGFLVEPLNQEPRPRLFQSVTDAGRIPQGGQ